MVNTASKTATKPKWLTNPKLLNTKKATLTGGFFYALILSFGHGILPWASFGITALICLVKINRTHHTLNFSLFVMHITP